MAKTSQRPTASKGKPSVSRNLKGARDAQTTATKSERITTILQRAKGASIAEIMTVTGWQPHSVRGFMSGPIVKRKGLTISSDKSGGERRYRIVEAGAVS